VFAAQYYNIYRNNHRIEQIHLTEAEVGPHCPPPRLLVTCVVWCDWRTVHRVRWVCGRTALGKAIYFGRRFPMVSRHIISERTTSGLQSKRPSFEVVFVAFQRLHQLRQGVTGSGHASAVMEQIKREKCRADTTQLGLVAREMQVCVMGVYCVLFWAFGDRCSWCAPSCCVSRVSSVCPACLWRVTSVCLA
jgi:hypothetical protein